jgi:hypothetical protein
VDAAARDTAARAYEKALTSARQQRCDPPARLAAPVHPETAALRAQHARLHALPDATGWEGPEFNGNYDVPGFADLAGGVPALPMPERTLAPDDGVLNLVGRRARLINPAARKVRI